MRIHQRFRIIQMKFLLLVHILRISMNCKHIRQNNEVGTPFKELQQVLPGLNRNQIQDLMKELKKDGELYKQKFFEAYGKYPA